MQTDEQSDAGEYQSKHEAMSFNSITTLHTRAICEDEELRKSKVESRTTSIAYSRASSMHLAWQVTKKQKLTILPSVPQLSFLARPLCIAKHHVRRRIQAAQVRSVCPMSHS